MIEEDRDADRIVLLWQDARTRVRDRLIASSGEEMAGEYGEWVRPQDPRLLFVGTGLPGDFVHALLLKELTDLLPSLTDATFHSVLSGMLIRELLTGIELGRMLAKSEQE